MCLLSPPLPPLLPYRDLQISKKCCFISELILLSLIVRFGYKCFIIFLVCIVEFWMSRKNFKLLFKAGDELLLKDSKCLFQIFKKYFLSRSPLQPTLYLKGTPVQNSLKVSSQTFSG